MLAWVTAIAAIIAAIGGLLPIWWRRPQLTLERRDGWNPNNLGLPFTLTNDGDRLVRNIAVVGLADGKVVTEPTLIKALEPRKQTLECVFFPPEYVKLAAGAAYLIPTSHLEARAKAGHTKVKVDLI